MQPHRKRPARRKLVKKKVAPGAGGAGPVSAGGRVPPRAKRGYQPKPPASGGGGVSFVTVLLGVVAMALLIATAMIMLPVDLEDRIDGYAAAPIPTDGENSEAKNWLPEMQSAVLDPTKKLEMTEAQVNRYLAKRLKGTQTGTFGGAVRYAGSYVDLRPGVAEVFIEREMFGMPLTMSVEVRRTEVSNGRETWKIGGGSIGRIQMGEATFGPVLKPFIRMFRTAVDDMDVMKAARNIDFAEGKLIIGDVS